MGETTLDASREQVEAVVAGGPVLALPFSPVP
jgi:hypothetical protein